MSEDYILRKEKGELRAVILTSGTEAEIALRLAEKIEGLRVVSIPCFELFNEQTKAYKNKILTNKPKIALEFSSEYSYHQYVKDGLYFCQNTFGASGSKTDVLNHFGFSEDEMIKKISKFLKNFE